MNCPTTDKSLFTLRKRVNFILLNPQSMLDMKSVTTGLEHGRVAWVKSCGPWLAAMAQSQRELDTKSSDWNPTLHDSDAWLLSVTGRPGNEHRHGGGGVGALGVTSKHLGSKRRPHARR